MWFKSKYSPKKFQRLIHCDPTFCDKEGHSLLHLAKMHGDHESARKLVLAGCDPARKNIWGLTPDDIERYLYPPSDCSLKVTYSKQGEQKELTYSELQQLFHFEYLSSLQFDSMYSLVWVVKKCLKSLEAYQKNNRWVAALYHKEIHAPILHRLKIQWISPSLGHGIFAQEEIPALTYIGEYTGVVRKKTRSKDLFNHYIFRYVIGPKETSFIIDAKSKGKI